MKKQFLLNICFIVCICNVVFGQSNPRFMEHYFYHDSTLQYNENIVFGTAKDWNGLSVVLSMDILKPRYPANPKKKYPLILLIHGGGFVNPNKDGVGREIELLSQQGFVTASIDYREGLNVYPDKWDSTLFFALYRAVQDSKAALRFLVHNAALYQIDTSAIFIGGVSSGALTAVSGAYFNQADWDRQYPWLRSNLGAIDSSTNKLKDTYTIKGIIDMWGGISDTLYISARDAHHTAIAIFQGTDDTIVSYTKPIARYKKMVPVEGGYLLAQRFKHLKGLYELNTMINGGHGEGFNPDFLAQRIGDFCKSISHNRFHTQEMSLNFEN